MDKPSEQFEKDVWAFVKALDPFATVFFNHKVQDINTKTLRQVDAWINAKYGGHIPISILVSCKKYKRKLNITHIESFNSEVRSTGASTGVIYSSSDFTGPALAKAKSLGLQCCRLFRNQPAELPTSLVFSLGNYVCYSRFRMILLQADYQVLKQKNITYWHELLNIRVTEDKTLLDYIVTRFCENEQPSNSNVIPNDWTCEYTFSPWDDNSFIVKMQVIGYWDIYHAKPECHLLNGSYCFSNASFVGGVGTPSIDIHSTTPGPGWERVERNAIFPTPIQSAIVFPRGDTFRQQLIESSKDKPLLVGPA